jgi:tetratricopeptide (TPR) repeat protein
MKKNIPLILLVLNLGVFTCVFAQEQAVKQDLSTLQEQAREYRSQGLEEQRLGNLDEAMAFYQKAIITDPFYVVAYNDLGIVYEAKGFIDQAEACYLKAIRLNPDYPNVYSNLAYLYEGKRDFEKAAFYWDKRMKLGPPDDPWRDKAEKRLRDLAEILPSLKARFMEEDAVRLNKELLIKKEVDAKKAQEHIKMAKKFYMGGEYEKAMQEMEVALLLDSRAPGGAEMFEMVSVKLREKERLANIQRMQQYFQEGIRLYQQDNPKSAQQEFDKILELTASPREK